MHRIFFCSAISFLFIFSPVFGQSGLINFEKTVENLGRFSSGDVQEIQHQFKFFVAGDGPVKIEHIEADCACSVADYTLDTIFPGNFGLVTVSFSPYKPGPFEKKFIVTARNAVPEKTELTIEGYIEPHGLEPQVEFPHLMGNFRFKSKKILLGTITNEAPVKREIEFFNNADREISFADSILAPNHLEFAFEAGKVIPAKSRGKFILYYHPEMKSDFGHVVDNIRFLNKETGEVEVDLDITASIRQHFAPSSLILPEIHPRLVVENEKRNLGKVYLADGQDIVFKISNSGKSDLVIQKVVANYGCEILELSDNLLQPYDDGTLKVRINDVGKKGDQDRSIIIFCNDPENTTKKITVLLDAQ